MGIADNLILLAAWDLCYEATGARRCGRRQTERLWRDRAEGCRYVRSHLSCSSMLIGGRHVYCSWKCLCSESCKPGTCLHPECGANAEDHDEEHERRETRGRGAVPRVSHRAHDDEQHGGAEELSARLAVAVARERTRMC